MAADPQQGLPWHQYWLTATIVVVIATTIAISYFSKPGFFGHEVGSSGYLASRYIEVTITGPVMVPGTYLLPKGTDLTRLLEKAKPLPEANVEPLLKNNKLTNHQVVRVPCRPTITVYVQGAVEKPGALRVPRGTRVKDLQKYVTLKEGADPTVFQKKGKLRQHDVVFVKMNKIPTKSVADGFGV